MINAISRNNAPARKMDIMPNPSTKNPPIAIPKAIPPFKMLKNIPFASSGLSGITEASIWNQVVCKEIKKHKDSATHQLENDKCCLVPFCY